MKKIFKRILSAVISFALAMIGTVAGSFPAALPVKAESVLTYEQTNVLDDLTNATIDGEKFSLENYPFDTRKQTKVLSFVEYCYSFYEDKQDKFGLYVYVYNPKGLAFETSSPLNRIQLTCGTSASESYKKYPLLFLNYSLKENYEGLFYKFKVWLTDSQKQDILQEVDKDNRVYRISGIELLTKGNLNATDYAVATTYSYSGYASGYGNTVTGENTLKYSSDQTEVLSLDVHATQYRPEGTNGKNDYTQDSLHSVYFAVPNDVLNRYGEMTALHATWLNAVLKPALVTGNQNAYNAIKPYLGKNIGKETDAFDYGYLGAYKVTTSGTTGILQTYSHSGFSYNRDYDSTYEEYGYAIETLYMLFHSGSATDSADNYTVSSEKIIEQMKASKSKYGGVIVNGKYSSEIFESYDSTFTEVNIRADENFSLTSETISTNWWDLLFHAGGTTVSATFDGIQAIYPVKASDVSGTAKEVSDRLYISESDYEEFYDFYEANKNTSTVYLFRYQVSDYIAQEATLFSRGSFLWLETWEEVDTNAYFFQETVNLDFDVIDVTFMNGTTETVIPVVANPIDVVPDATPPVYTESDEKPNWWKLILLIIGLILLWIFSPLVVIIIKFLIWLICLPFKALGKAFKWIGRRLKGKRNDKG